MSYSKIQIEPPRYAEPYGPLAHAAANAARLSPLGKIAAGPAVRDPDVRGMAAQLGEEYAHTVLHELAHALDLTTGDEHTAKVIWPVLDRIRQTIREATAPAEMGGKAPLIAGQIRALLTSATDGHANRALRELIEKYPQDNMLCDAAVELAIRIRTHASLRNAHPRPPIDGEEPQPGEDLIQLAQEGETRARNQESATITAHNGRLVFAPTEGVTAHGDANEQAGRLHVAPTIYHHFDVRSGDGVNRTVLVYQHHDRRIAQLLEEPFPANYPAARISEMCETYIQDAAHAGEPDHNGATAHTVSCLAQLGLADLTGEQLAVIRELKPLVAQATIHEATAGNTAAASLLAQQAGLPGLTFDGMRRTSGPAMAKIIRNAIGPRAAREAAVRNGGRIRR